MQCAPQRTFKRRTQFGIGIGLDTLPDDGAAWCGSMQSGKGHAVSVMRRGGEVDTIFGFEKEADALEWIKEKSQAWMQTSAAGKRP